jgi:hypothetical protein
VPPTALIVRARTANPRNFTVRKYHTRRHALCLSPEKPYLLPSAAFAWLLRSSHHHHGSLRWNHLFHLKKFDDHLISHAPPCAGDISGEILHPDPRATCTRALTRGPPAPRPAPTADVSPSCKKKKKREKEKKAYPLFFVLFCRYFLYSLFISNG